MSQYTLRDFQPVEAPNVWDCPACGEFQTESYGGAARHHYYCADNGRHYLHDYFGERLAVLYRRGISRNALADRLGVGRKTMSDALRSLDVTLRDTAEAVNVWLDGLDEETREGVIHRGQDKAAETLDKWREKNPDWHKENAVDNLPEATHGQEHPSWRGGESIRQALIRLYGDQSWDKTRTEIRERQETCALCNETPSGKSLDVHHIVPVLCGGDNGGYNLLGLCSPCHRRVESYTRSIPEIAPVFTE